MNDRSRTTRRERDLALGIPLATFQEVLGEHLGANSRAAEEIAHDYGYTDTEIIALSIQHSYAVTENGDTDHFTIVEGGEDALAKVLARKLQEGAGCENIYTVHNIQAASNDSMEEIGEVVKDPISVMHHIHATEDYRFSVWPSAEKHQEFSRSLARGMTINSGEKVHYADSER